MKTSPTGRALIAQREGRKLAAYYDSKGILTIGVGHTGRMSPPPVTAGMTITSAQCDAMLAADLAPVEAAVNMSVKVPMAQNQFDALASLGFNIGIAGLQGSTVIKRLNLGDVSGAADAFLLWDHPKVLASRRRAERAQFLGAIAPRELGRSPPLTRSSAVIVVTAGAATVATTYAYHSWAAIVGGVAVAAAACAVAVILFGKRSVSAASHAEPHVTTPLGNDKPETISSHKQ